MREIKFRVWDEQFKRMSKKPEQIRLNIANGNVHGSRSGGNVETWRLMQYTGLKDKSGIDIYEGDIVRFDVMKGDDDNQPYQSYEKGVVSINPSGVSFGKWVYEYVTNMVIIGNIHSHPELLEGDK